MACPGPARPVHEVQEELRDAASEAGRIQRLELVALEDCGNWFMIQVSSGGTADI